MRAPALLIIFLCWSLFIGGCRPPVFSTLQLCTIIIQLYSLLYSCYLLLYNCIQLHFQSLAQLRPMARGPPPPKPHNGCPALDNVALGPVAPEQGTSTYTVSSHWHMYTCTLYTVFIQCHRCLQVLVQSL